MRPLRKNKQRMYYSLFLQNEPKYETDRDGNILYDDDGDPIETGDPIDVYSRPVEFRGNIAGNGGRVRNEAYGAYGDYDAILYMRKGDVPLHQEALIWYESDPLFNGDDVDPTSADYRVKRVPPCLDEIVYLLERVVK